MKFAAWIKPALWGGVAGAAAVGFLGFTMGGWVTPGVAREQAEITANNAVALALTPYCVSEATNNPNAASVLTELNSASSYQRRGIVSDAGWATPMGETEPNSALAQRCQQALAEIE
jgi:hypothetical protein